MLRIIVVTQDDPFYLPHFFSEFVGRCDPSRVEVVGAVIQPPLGKRSLRTLVGQMWEFYGPADFMRMGVRYAVNRVLNLVALRVCHGRFPGVFSVEHVLRKSRWSILPCTNVNSQEFLQLIERRAVDLVVSVAASQKFKSDVLAAPRLGCINIHTARLPRNRGMLPNFWALYDADREPFSAVTVHRMNEELDDGPIILQEEFPLDTRESLHRLIIRTKRLGAAAVGRALELFEHGAPPTIPNDRSLATYHSFPTREDVVRFREKGLRLL